MSNCGFFGPSNLDRILNSMMDGADCPNGLNTVDEGLDDCNIDCQLAGKSDAFKFASLFTEDANGHIALRVHFQALITETDKCQQPLLRPKDECDWERVFSNFIGMSNELTATGILTLAANVSDTETVTTGTKVYQFQTVLTDVDGNVLIGATASDSIDNLIAAITLGAGAGVTYAASMTANTFVTAAVGAGDTMGATALTSGDTGNDIATTETSATASWGAVTLTGGQTSRPTLIITQS